MDAAVVRGIDERSPNEAAQPHVTTWDFDVASPAGTWLAQPLRRGYDYADDGFAVEAGGGLEGAGLAILAGAPKDASAIALSPVGGLSRVRVSGRVRLDGHPAPESADSREVLRVVELSSAVEHPKKVSRFGRYNAPVHRVSRKIDPSGWDRFETSFVTRSSTETIEIQLLSKTGGDASAVTRYDDLRIEHVPLGGGEIIAHMRERYKPRDGREEATPWRLRVELAGEMRDAVLLPPPASLAFPLRVPPADSSPQLRFHYGMAPEAFRADGDGARITVVFRDDSGETEVGALEFDPKNEREHRAWLPALFDLSAVADREGELVFSVSDVAEPADALDVVLLSTPRIEPASEAPSAYNVLLIGVDTLRADHLSAFGYERPTTPNLERLAQEGVLFLGARSQAPWTLPSFSSILTSLYPSVHGAGRGGHDEWEPIDPTTTALPEVLARVGYETQGIVANGLISPSYGLDQGFAAYQWGWVMESVQRDVPRVNAFVEGHTTTPWFLFWHIMDPHLPYMTADEHREAFTDGDYGGRFRNGERFAVPFEVLDPRPGRRWFTHEGPPPPPELEDDDRRFVHDYYDAEIAEMDAAIGRVVEALEASGQWERTIVALIADHGEGLGDHDHYHHGYTLFDDQVHVPMLVRIPGHEALVIERPVASIDLAPTLLGALGIEPPEFFQGVDRLAPDAPTDDPTFLEYPTYDSSAQKGWIVGDFKYLHDPLFRTEALYDLKADPGELVDVAAQHPEVVAGARAALDEFRWTHLQKGRFHLRLRGEPGQRLRFAFTTDDLFDANFVCRPMVPEEHFQMDLERKTLALDTVLEDGRLELVFWCRGDALQLALSLDDEPFPGGLVLGEDEEPRGLPADLGRPDIPTLEGAERLGWPDFGQAVLWLEAGVAQSMPVVLSPEEIEVLKELGYAR